MARVCCSSSRAYPEAHVEKLLLTPSTACAFFSFSFFVLNKLRFDAKKHDRLPLPTTVRDFTLFRQRVHRFCFTSPSIALRLPTLPGVSGQLIPLKHFRLPGNGRGRANSINYESRVATAIIERSAVIYPFC